MTVPDDGLRAALLRIADLPPAMGPRSDAMDLLDEAKSIARAALAAANRDAEPVCAECGVTMPDFVSRHKTGCTKAWDYPPFAATPAAEPRRTFGEWSDEEVRAAVEAERLDYAATPAAEPGLRAWDEDRLEAMRAFAHAVGMALTERKVPEEWDAEHLTDPQMLEGTATLLDRLDDATDRWVQDRKVGDIPPVSRQMQADLRALAARLKPDLRARIEALKWPTKPDDYELVDGWYKHNAAIEEVLELLTPAAEPTPASAPPLTNASIRVGGNPTRPTVTNAAPSRTNRPPTPASAEEER